MQYNTVVLARTSNMHSDIFFLKQAASNLTKFCTRNGIFEKQATKFQIWSTLYIHKKYYIA